MQFTHLRLRNWRNFVSVDLALGERLFITGPNASGKSNLLDVFRFLRDLVKTGGGLQQAVRDRLGLSKIRCLAARSKPDVEIEVELQDKSRGAQVHWRYGIGIHQDPSKQGHAMVRFERVWKDNRLVLDRPDPDHEDARDPLRLTQTHLEQINANQGFRELADTFRDTLYLHLVPQLLKFPHLANPEAGGEDPFGAKFMDRIMDTPEKTRRARLRKIETALRIAVPELTGLTDVRDERGRPHLEAVYSHWRPGGGKQREDQFSDGTLRLIGLLWTLLEGDSLLLLEEPELSLHSSIVSRLPPLIWRLQRARKRQIIVSSHSTEFFNDPGIRPHEVALLFPQGSEGTRVELASERAEISTLLDGGMSVAEAVLPFTAPTRVEQLHLFE